MRITVTKMHTGIISPSYQKNHVFATRPWLTETILESDLDFPRLPPITSYKINSYQIILSHQLNLSQEFTEVDHG